MAVSTSLFVNAYYGSWQHILWWLLVNVTRNFDPVFQCLKRPLMTRFLASAMIL